MTDLRDEDFDWHDLPAAEDAPTVEPVPEPAGHADEEHDEPEGED